MSGVQAVFHTATLHKPHIATHPRQDFVDTNVTGTLNLLEEAAAAGVASFVYTSTTSIFGDALPRRQAQRHHDDADRRTQTDDRLHRHLPLPWDPLDTP